MKYIHVLSDAFLIINFFDNQLNICLENFFSFLEFTENSYFFFTQEEQNASSSANYDVELLHPSAAHDDLMKSGKLREQAMMWNFSIPLRLMMI